MIIYVLKFSACLAVFMVFYKLLLEKSSVHTFKRFYLLTSLCFAFAIPSITFIEYVEPVIIEEFATFNTMDFDVIESSPEVIAINHTPIILWSIYALGVFIFLLKFCLNLKRIIYKIRNNPKYKSQGFINVLITNLRIPHTFFNYIFFDKQKFECSDIPKEVFIHEQTHAKQKHSIDVLLLEILQIIFWFNPLIYLLKRDIKLNHEYLADQAVLNNGIEPSTYQTILLAFSSKAQHQELANAINYSSIKKRFTVMKTHTSKTSIWLRGLLILPVLATLFYGFTERELVEREVIIPEVLELYLNENGELLLDDEIITFEDIKALYKEDPKLQISVKIFPDANADISKNITSKLKDIGFKKMTVCTSRVAEFQNFTQEKATPQQLAEYNKLARHYNEQPKDKQIIKRKDVLRLEYLYKIMSEEQKKNAEPFPNMPPPPPAPPILSPEQLEEYNKLAKKYNDMLEKLPIKVKDYKYLESLYQSMSEEQKQTAQPFPSFATIPPPPPPAPAKKVSHDMMWILLNSKGQFLVNDEFATLNTIELQLKTIANNTEKSKEIVFKYDENAPKEIVDKINELIDDYGLENIIDTLPPPPPPPTTPKSKNGNGPNANDSFENQMKTGFIKINGTPHYFVNIDNNTKYYNRQGFEVNKSGKIISKYQVNASGVIPGQYITKVYSDGQIVSEFKDNKPSNDRTIIDIPTPPKPISPLDHVIDMAKKNATFFYEGRNVSSDRAIKLIKNNQELNIFTKNGSTNKPRVFLTKDTSIDNESQTKELPKPNRENIVSHIKVMNRHNAKFYLGKKAITYDEALNYVKKHKNADVNSSMETNTTVITFPQNKKSTIPVIINGKTPVNDIVKLSKKGTINLKLDLKKTKIISFKIKVMGKPSQSISGNTLNKKAKGFVSLDKSGSAIQLFDIKDEEGYTHPPIIIEVSE
ncbi:M56 family metallopeptidase [Psychroserpens sp. Hel_I_66]|uniref:M56 family metallopeptidase n=1 Tax=Psychroserpens sp. Hel_I_66 TaxID=1250004 RepID=UPI00068FB5EE|nr:M56 family metallopeptidase [Psychroserpens sp. Hel_I_66]